MQRKLRTGIAHILNRLYNLSRQRNGRTFEYDPAKSASNKVKHGVDFEEAQRLWDGPTVSAPLGNEHGEERLAVFGMMNGKHWTAIVTMRGDNIRIISVRRSRAKEEAYYDGIEKD